MQTMYDCILVIFVIFNKSYTIFSNNIEKVLKNSSFNSENNKIILNTCLCIFPAFVPIVTWSILNIQHYISMKSF
mgnify:CR=1 FL=1